VTTPAQGADGASDLPSPLTSVEDMRATAKWTLAVVGATGAALISGGPLVAVGQVHGVAHAVLAGAGLACALGGIWLAIWFTSRVLMPRLTTPAVFTEQQTSVITGKTSLRLASLTEQIDKSPTYFFGELATIDCRQRSADAQVIEDANFAILSREAFLSFVRSNPDVALEMLPALTDRLRRTDELLRSRVSRNANEEEKARLTLADRAADLIAEFGGSWKFIGVSNALIRMVFHPEPGLQTCANSLDGSSGLPIARMRQSAFVVIASTAVHSCAGMPHASSRITST